MGSTPWTLTQTSSPTNQNIPVEGTFMSPTELRVRPSLNSLRDGERYTLTLSLRSASTNGGTTDTFTASFDFQVRPAMVMPFTTQVSGLTVTNTNPLAPFGSNVFDFNSNNFTLSFNPAVGAVRYEIYARDTRNNPNYVRVQLQAATGAPRIEMSFNLPVNFNAPFGGQPLGGGNRVNFAVVGIDTYGTRAPLMAATPVEVRDTFPPTANSVVNAATGSPIVDAQNDTASPATIRLRIGYSEPMDPMSMVTFTSNASNAPMSAWTWETTSSGILTLTIGANNDASGSFAIRGGRDAAGNDIARAGDLVGSLTGRRELLANGDFQMGAACGLGSWTPSGGGPAAVAVNNNGAISGSTSACAAVLGSIPGGMSGTGRSRLVQDVSLPSLMGTGHRLEFNGRYRVVNVPNAAAPGATYAMGCRLTTPADVVLIGLFVNGGTNTTGYTNSGTVDVSAQSGNSVRVQCETDNTNPMAPGFGAMYLDELSVALVKPGTL